MLHLMKKLNLSQRNQTKDNFFIIFLEIFDI